MIEKFVRDFFSKKFVTRMEYFSQDYYTISYSGYRFIPFWKEIKLVFDQVLDSKGNKATSTRIFNKREGNEFLKTLNCIDDVKSFYVKSNIEIPKSSIENAIDQVLDYF